jgi:DNA end-binding protein Ku
MPSRDNTRPVWRGHLRLALVGCPIALHSVLHGTGGLHFHLINPKTGHRIRMVTLDAETDQEISRSDLVKGYEFEKDRYLLLEDHDFEHARIESSNTLTINKFVDSASINPIYFDTSYYVTVDGAAGEDIFVVLRDAIRKSHVAALSRIVIAQRERAVAIMPSGKGLICHTLHDPRDLWDSEPLWKGLPAEPPDDDLIALATQLIDRQSGRFKPEDTTDRYEARLREVIEAKLAGKTIEPENPEDADRGNVVDLMAALKTSLGQQKAKSSTRGGSERLKKSKSKAKSPTPPRKGATRKRAS